MHTEEPWDDTRFRWPRCSMSDAPITEPAKKSGFFVARFSLAYACAAVLALAWVVAVSGCGPSDMQAMQAVADDRQAAENAAGLDQHTARQVELIYADLKKPRPAHITPADWELAQRAINKDTK